MKGTGHIKKRQKIDRVLLFIFGSILFIGVLCWFVADFLQLINEGDTPTYFGRYGEWSTRSLHFVLVGLLLISMVIAGIKALKKRNEK